VACNAPRVRSGVLHFFLWNLTKWIRFVHGNLFGQETLKGDFLVLDLDNSHDNIFSDFVSHFNSDSKSIKWQLDLAMWANTE